MSSKVAFQVHYGDFYRITHDSYGVNLSALERRQCSLDKPLERSFESIRKCLHRMFNVNPKTHLFTVHTLTSWEGACRPAGGRQAPSMDHCAIFLFTYRSLPPTWRQGYRTVKPKTKNIFL